MKIAIIIPAYNEEKRIGKTLEAYYGFFDEKTKAGGVDFEILVVINNTIDKTEEIVKKQMKGKKRISYLNLKRGGKGLAVVEGFKEMLNRNADLIGFVDADMATPPEEFHRLANSINNFEGIIASRYLKGAVVKPKQSWQRIAVSRAFNFLIRSLLFLPYRDTQCGAKIFKREAVKKIVPEITMSQWAFDVDLLFQAKRRGLRIKESPTVWADREYSKINFLRSGPKMALGVIRLRLLHSPVKIFIRVYDRLSGLK